jgi:uncharacterized protein (TIGR02757 family)
MNQESIKHLLDELYEKYKNSYENDPIVFPHRYKNEEDIEIVGLIASSLAYGRVELFMPIIEKILSKMGNSPAEFIRNFDITNDIKCFEGIYYRFYKEIDIIALIYCLSKALKEWGSLKKLFISKKNTSGTIKEALIQFRDEIIKHALSNPYLENTRSMLSSPAKNSACKKLNLFLRWMVRDKDIDFGIWKEVGKDNLIIPLDTHVGRISRCLGLLTRKNDDWKAAEELTQSLKKFDSEDPVKYDYALCHIGIDRICNSNNCDNCTMRKINDL